MRAPTPNALRRHLASLSWAGVVMATVTPSAPRASPVVARAPLHDWLLIDGRHWQVADDASRAEDPLVTDAAEGTRGSCPAGMVEVSGRMKSPNDVYAVDELQRSVCATWIDPAFPERCARFDREAWLRLSQGLPTEPKHFCIDRFEYPNEKGAFPWIMVSWSEAGTLCAREGKRLCSEAEWTFACEGEEALPYPNGYARDAEACVIDRKGHAVDEEALEVRSSARALLELDRLWLGEASGTRPMCRSVFGVYDMTGNVDEWTTSVRADERPSILKGGYWGPVRTRCRPSTRAHGPSFAFYQLGFRCCADVT
jgi:hypothetical protein